MSGQAPAGNQPPGPARCARLLRAVAAPVTSAMLLLLLLMLWLLLPLLVPC